MDAIEFLREKEILEEGCTEWLVRWDDGHEVDIVKLLAEFGQAKFKEGLAAENEDE